MWAQGGTKWCGGGTWVGRHTRGTHRRFRLLWRPERAGATRRHVAGGDSAGAGCTAGAKCGPLVRTLRADWAIGLSKRGRCPGAGHIRFGERWLRVRRWCVFHGKMAIDASRPESAAPRRVVHSHTPVDPVTAAACKLRGYPTAPCLALHCCLLTLGEGAMQVNDSA